MLFTFTPGTTLPSPIVSPPLPCIYVYQITGVQVSPCSAFGTALKHLSVRRRSCASVGRVPHNYHR